jgi:DNA-binding Lrp family transcriptional regulator
METESMKSTRLLSNVDREILKAILSPNGKHSSSTLLSKKLGVPQTTIQRRRTRLEKEFLEYSYSLNLEKFGWRRVDLLIYTRNGKTDSVARQLLENDEVTYVGKSIGEHTIDLRVEIIVKDNAELLNILEKVKAMEGVQDTVWSEIVEVVGKKRSVPSWIIVHHYKELKVCISEVEQIEGVSSKATDDYSSNKKIDWLTIMEEEKLEEQKQEIPLTTLNDYFFIQNDVT